jgi:very-short-patch-repair endonuclease
MSIENARRLRKDTTDAERKLWSALHHKQLDGFKFRRQVPYRRLRCRLRLSIGTADYRGRRRSA